jgi:hypothetical protein
MARLFAYFIMSSISCKEGFTLLIHLQGNYEDALKSLIIEQTAIVVKSFSTLIGVEN